MSPNAVAPHPEPGWLLRPIWGIGTAGVPLAALIEPDTGGRSCAFVYSALLNAAAPPLVRKLRRAWANA